MTLTYQKVVEVMSSNSVMEMGGEIALDPGASISLGFSTEPRDVSRLHVVQSLAWYGAQDKSPTSPADV
jgi:hypothetical protein